MYIYNLFAKVVFFFFFSPGLLLLSFLPVLFGFFLFHASVGSFFTAGNSIPEQISFYTFLQLCKKVNNFRSCSGCISDYAE